MNELVDISKLVICGDVELWVAYAGEWEMPILCVPHYLDPDKTTRFYKCRVGVNPPTGNEINQLHTLLIHRCIVWEKDNTFVMLAAHLDMAAYKAPGITPEYYRKSNRVFEPPRMRTVECSQTVKSFLQWYLQTSGFDEEKIQYFWTTFLQSMLHWLTRYHRPIDFGWAKVFAVPLRADWKEQIIKQNLVSKYWPNRADVPSKELRKTVYNPDIKSMNQWHNTVRWTLEIVPTTQFSDYITMLERREMAKSGPAAYAFATDKFLSEHQNLIFSCLASYLDEANYPSARVHDSGVPGGRSYSPHFEDQSNHRKLVCVVKDAKIIDKASPPKPQPVGKYPEGKPRRGRPPKVKAVPQVPDVQLDEEDMRHSGRNGD